MAIGISPRLPMHRDERNGFGMNEDYTSMTMQNLKMIILTSPGERTMDPDFGVGIKRYIFEPDHDVTYGDLKARIVNQVRDYLPYVQIDDIKFKSNATGYSEIRANRTNIIIKFTIIPLGVERDLELEI
tara:strand:- start:1000 stop:1386 length:387 start_codon:yes stop_codon:yes gene_type:complete